MLTRQERNAFILLVIVTIVIITAFLVIESIGKSTFSTQFTRTTPDGTLVRLDGNVDRVTVTKNGGDLIFDVNGTTVFIPASTVDGVSLKKGDVVQLYGIVQTYHGEKEILVQQPGDIILV